MTEFLTLNQIYVKPPNPGLDAWYGFGVGLILVFLLYELARFIQWVIDKFYTVRVQDYLDNGKSERREENVGSQ